MATNGTNFHAPIHSLKLKTFQFFSDTFAVILVAKGKRQTHIFVQTLRWN